MKVNYNLITQSPRFNFVSLQVWESCSDAAISFGGEEQEGPLAHVVENDLTVSALTKVEKFLEVEIIKRRKL